MTNHTLVLNSDFSPLSIIPVAGITWKEAIRMQYLGQCDVLEYYSNWEVHSPRVTMPVPSVMISKTFVRKKPMIRFTRHNLLIRDRYQCQYCGCQLNNNTLTVDHVVPRVRGGKTKWENVSCSCHRCNSRKGHRTDIKPVIAPYKPDYYQLLQHAKTLPIVVPDASWIDYLGWPNELVTIRPPNKDINKHIV